MDTELPQTTAGSQRRRPARSPLLPLCALVAIALPVAAVPVLATPGSGGPSTRLDASLTRIANLTERRLRPRTARLARDLPAEARRLRELREPADTARDQIEIALDELRQMGALANLDPHYPTALVAAGRAFVAISGADPVTRTTINPEYPGLEAELETSVVRLERSSRDTDVADGAVRRLRRELRRARRQARLLQRRLGAIRAGPGREP